MKRLAFALVCLLVSSVVGCGGGSSTGGQVTITITPISSTVVPGATQQFTASVKNSTNTSVTWAVNGTVGGNSTVGTINSSGLYTAPTTIPTPPNITVTAGAAADSSVTASAAVTIQPAISLSPATVSVAAGQTQQFSATVNFSKNTAVTWQVNSLNGGNSNVGTINSSGLYTAPSVFPVPTGITVTAVAQADANQKASATVTVTPPPLVISPAATTLAGGAQQAFTATALGQTVSPSWSVTCPSSATGACGAITPAGVFTAPVSPPEGSVITVHATMPDGSAAPGSTTVTVKVSNATLSGAYVFTLSSPNLAAVTAEAGVITFDGAGNIVSGAFDIAGNSSGAAAIDGGTYQVGTDGRGSATIQTAGGNQSWQFVMANHASGFVTAVGSGGSILTGTLDLQQLPQALNNLAGAFVLAVRGIVTGNTPTPFAMAGSFSADGSGNVTSGLFDFNNNFTAATNVSGGGTYSAASAAGRGTIKLTSTIATQQFAYYAINSSRLKIVEIDSSRSAFGELFRAPAGPLTTSSFAGRYAVTMSGVSASSPFAMGGVFSLDGSVGVDNRVLDGVNQTVADNEGSYFLSDVVTGRTTLSWDVNHGVFLQYAMYPRDDGGFVILELDSSAIAIGDVLPQSVVAPGLNTLAGGFAVGLSGFEPVSLASPESITGQVTYSVGQALTGTFDISSNSTINTAQALQANVISVDPNTGRSTLAVLSGSSALSNGFVEIYIVDSNTALVFDSDGARLLTGVLMRQF